MPSVPAERENQEATPRPAPQTEPAAQTPAELPAPDRSSGPLALADDGPEAATAARMIREAHEMARHLGLDHMPDTSRPTVYEITLEPRDDLERAALKFLNVRPFACVRSVSNRQDGVVSVRLDLAIKPPSIDVARPISGSTSTC